MDDTSLPQIHRVTANVLAMNAEKLSRVSIFARFNILSALGMLADEHNIGEPERPYAQWATDDFKAVVALFQTWPEDAMLTAQMQVVAQAFDQHFRASVGTAPRASRRQRMDMAAQAMAHGCRTAFGADFGDIALVYEPHPRDGYYGGLVPEENKIQINENRLADTRVLDSIFHGDVSFIELIGHEATHLIQRHLADISDGRTPGAPLNMQVAQAFYESTEGAKRVARAMYHPLETDAQKAERKIRRALYEQHPFEVQARAFASRIAILAAQAMGRAPHPGMVCKF